MDLRIERADILSRDAQQLIAELNAELNATYPEEGATHFRLDLDEVAPGKGGFFIARDGGGAAVGCGAIRKIEADACEIKRMFVRPAARGRKISRAILERLIDESRGLGASRVLLETGTRQIEAMALYERAGFARVPPWGEYLDSPLSVCMGKAI